MRTPEQKAFHKRRDEKNIPIKAKIELTRSWFRSRNQTTWSTFLPPRFPPTKPWKMLQIGVFEGADLVWCLENILCHPESHAVAIDPWEATTKLDAEYMESVRLRAYRNLEPWMSKVSIFQGKSQDLLPGLTIKCDLPFMFDLVVIDGDHTEDAVLQDAELCLPITKIGGVMIFDDVRNRIPKKHHVQQGLDRFLAVHGKRVRLLWKHRFVDAYQRIS